MCRSIGVDAFFVCATSVAHTFLFSGGKIMVTNLIGFISTLTSIVGVIAFFCKAFPLLIFCAVISILNSFIQVIFGEQNNFTTEIATIILFGIISFFAKANIPIMISFGICIADVIMSVLGWISIFIFWKINK